MIITMVMMARWHNELTARSIYEGDLLTTTAYTLERPEYDQLKIWLSASMKNTRRMPTWIIVCARAQAREKRRNTNNETKRTCFRPKMSDHLPYSGVNERLQYNVNNKDGAIVHTALTW